eukprot:1157409-Pelagomonas_calceolata.AAC.1
MPPLSTSHPSPFGAASLLPEKATGLAGEDVSNFVAVSICLLVRGGVWVWEVAPTPAPSGAVILRWIYLHWMRNSTNICGIWNSRKLPATPALQAAHGSAEGMDEP